MNGRVLAGLIGVGLEFPPLCAQGTIPVAPGDLLRVQAANLTEGWVTGMLVWITADTIVLVRSGSTATIAVPRIFVFEIDVVRPRSAGAGFARGAAFGALAGGVALGVAGYASGDDPGGFLSYTAGQKAVLGILVGSVGGGLLGGMIGSTFPGMHWEKVYEAARPAPIARVSGRGVQVGVRIPMPLFTP